MTEVVGWHISAVSRVLSQAYGRVVWLEWLEIGLVLDGVH